MFGPEICTFRITFPSKFSAWAVLMGVNGFFFCAFARIRC